MVVAFAKIPYSNFRSPVSGSVDNPITTWSLQHKVDNNTWQVEHLWRNVGFVNWGTVYSEGQMATMLFIQDSIKSQNYRQGLPVLFTNSNTGVMTVELSLIHI